MNWKEQLLERQAKLRIVTPTSTVIPVPVTITPTSTIVESIPVPSQPIMRPDFVTPTQIMPDDGGANQESTHEDNVEQIIDTNSHKVGKIFCGPQGAKQNKSDYHCLEWGRHRDAGFRIGKKFSIVPMFFTADGHTVHFEDMGRGTDIMIVGPNMSQDDCIRINNADITSYGYDTVKIRTTYWSSLKEPSIIPIEYYNRCNVKLLPIAYSEIKMSNNKYLFHAPSTFYFRRSESFSGEKFLIEDGVYASNSSDSIFVSILKIIYVMGYRRIFVVGAHLDDPISLGYANIVAKILKDNGVSIYQHNSNFEYENKSLIDMLSVFNN